MTAHQAMHSIPQWETGTRELAPGVFAYVQASGGMCISNAGLLVGTAGVTAVDALFVPSMTQTLLSEAARISSRPVKRLVTTHHHLDHTLGNALFPRDATVVAHARAREEMERVGLPKEVFRRIVPQFADEVDGSELRLPDETFDGESLGLDLGEWPARLLHFGTAHTRGDVLVHLPEQRVLFAGDVAFFYVTPLAFEGHVGNWIRICRQVLDEIDADVIVPGHGPPGTKEDLARMLRYLELVHASARRAFDGGASPEEAVAAVDLGEYAEWGEAERIAPNISRCYREFRGELASVLE